MVVAEEMQDAVDQQLVKAFIYAEPGHFGFLKTGIHRYDDIPKQLGIDIAMGPFTHRKGDDVGGPLMLQVVLIELSDTRVVYDQDG